MDQHEADDILKQQWQQLQALHAHLEARYPAELQQQYPAWQDGTEPRISAEQAVDLRRWFNKESV